MSAWVAHCPAKINLGLAVLGKRPDGYHEIVTIFQAIALADALQGEPAAELTLTCDDPAVPVDDRNLVLQAARAVRAHRPEASRRGARLRLSKRIPAGGGLGGGSSDAAGAVLLLDALWSLRLTPAEHIGIAAALGSDVPFFLAGGTALGTGRGESIRPLPAIADRPLVLGTPPFGMSTSEVYARLREPLTPPRAAGTLTRLFVKFAEGNDFARATNDLEPSAFAWRAELAAFRNALIRSGAEPALLSGSGSTVFGLFREEDAAAAAAVELAGEFVGWSVLVTTTVSRGARIERSGSAAGSTEGSR